MNNLVKYLVENKFQFLNEEVDQLKLLANLQKIQEKLDKALQKLEKYQTRFDKIMTKYKQHPEYHQFVPVDVMANFKYVPYNKVKELESDLGKHLSFPNNYIAYEMYSDAHHKYPEYKETMSEIYWEYFCKLDEICESIYRVEQEIKDLESKNLECLLKINKKKSMNELVDDLFRRVPELKKFIEICGEKQLAFLIKENERLKIAWEKYNKAKEDGEENFRKLLPKRLVRTQEQLENEVNAWKKHESELMATRLTTEFGEIEKTNLYLGADENVNGIIVGSKKSARIETIFAGGYNIQCLHTRLLIHER